MSENDTQNQSSRDIVFKNRFADLMSDNGWDHEKAAKEISKHYCKEIRKKTIDGYTLMKHPIPRLEVICAIADTFNVDVGYLYGDYDDRSIKQSKVSTLTGLNELAADELLRSRHDPERNEIYNFLLSDQDFPLLIKAIYEYIHSQNADIADSRYGDLDYNQIKTLSKFKVVELFEHIIEKAYKQNIETAQKERFYIVADTFMNETEKEIDGHNSFIESYNTLDRQPPTDFLSRTKDSISSLINFKLDTLREYRVYSCLFSYTAQDYIDRFNEIAAQYEKEKAHREKRKKRQAKSTIMIISDKFDFDKFRNRAII